MSQEEIVDNIILDFLEEKHPTSKSLILACPDKAKKRTAMLSVLDRENQDIFDDYKKIVEAPNNYKCHEYIIEVTQLLREYIKVADTDIKNYGEVLTPTSLIDDMLDFLPIEVWSNKDLKWLDPCNGVGTFPAVVVTRLMAGLKDVIPNDCERYKHIVNNMIYVCEIQAKNMFLYHCSFDREDEHKLNTYFGSFLTDEFNEHMTNVWGVEKFDLIIGNPPYNDNTGNKGVGHSLWDKFVMKSLNILIEGGYLNFVHPSGWRNVDGGFKKIQRIMLSKTFIYLSINSPQEGQRVFGSTTNFDYYCLLNDNNHNNIKTKIKCIDGTIEEYCLNNLEFIPNGMFDYIFSLIAKDNEEKVNLLHSESTYAHRKEYMSAEKNDTFKYPCIWSIKKGGTPTFKYSSIDKGHFGVKKIIFGNGANPTYMKDEFGEYGMTQFSFGVYGYDLDIIEKSIQSNGIKKITEMTKFVSTEGNPILYPKIISLFRKDFWKEFI